MSTCERGFSRIFSLQASSRNTGCVTFNFYCIFVKHAFPFSRMGPFKSVPVFVCSFSELHWNNLISYNYMCYIYTSLMLVKYDATVDHMLSIYVGEMWFNRWSRVIWPLSTRIQFPAHLLHGQTKTKTKRLCVLLFSNKQVRNLNCSVKHYLL